MPNPGDEHAAGDIPPEMTPERLEQWFKNFRHDPAHHLGLGDVRLTIGQQDEIVAIQEASLARIEELEKIAFDKVALNEHCVVLEGRIEELEEERDADWRKFLLLRDDNERIRVLGEELAEKGTHIEELESEKKILWHLLVFSGWADAVIEANLADKEHPALAKEKDTWTERQR